MIKLNDHIGKDTFVTQQWLCKTVVIVESQRMRLDLSDSININSSETNYSLQRQKYIQTLKWIYSSSLTARIQDPPVLKA